MFSLMFVILLKGGGVVHEPPDPLPPTSQVGRRPLTHKGPMGRPVSKDEHSPWKDQARRTSGRNSLEG